MNNDKPVALVLGGTNPHRALIEKLKIRGFYTVLVDYFENPPAKNIADEHEKESTLDIQKVLECNEGAGSCSSTIKRCRL